MEKDRLWTLMARKLSGELTQAELRELDDFLNLSAKNNLPTQFVAEYWATPTENEADFLEATYHLHTEKLKNKGYNISINQHKPEFLEYINIKNGKPLKIAAAAFCSFICIAILMYNFYYKTTQNTIPSQALLKNEISTKNGSRTKIQLPDGSTVWLNSSSHLTYANQNFGATIREVTLSGEAYFDIAKDSLKPFIIHTAKMNIKVLGTAFNVKAYPTDKTAETTLIHGSVEVTLNDRQEKIMLKPREKLILNSLHNTIQKATSINTAKQSTEKEKPIIELSHLTTYPKNNAIVETAWMENRLVFQNETFEDIALKMERWYGIPIVIKTEHLKKELITGSFEKETIYQALHALKFTNNFTYKTIAGKIIISQY